MADNSAVSGGIWPKFERIQSLKVVLLTCKTEEDRIKSECTRVLTTFLPLLVYGQITQHSVVRSGRMLVMTARDNRFITAFFKALSEKQLLR